MKLDIDNIRNILLYLETLELGEYATINSISNNTNISEDNIIYTCLKLKEADLINATTFNAIGRTYPTIHSISAITFEGHQFLENIRDNGNWSIIKEQTKKVGSFSLNVISKVALAVITSKINNLNL